MVGLPFQIGLASRTAAVPLADVVRVAAGLAQQLSRDFLPIWGLSATVAALPNPDAIGPGIWPIFIEDRLEGDLAGFHLTAQNQPYARIEAGPSWSLTASHECLEMLADPTGSRLYGSTGIELVAGAFRDVPGAKVEYLVEVCDPCQDAACAYLVNDVLVSDFITPQYFDPVAVASVRYSFSGRVARPREVLPGGLLSWRDPQGTGFIQAVWSTTPELRMVAPPPVAAPLREAMNAGRGAALSHAAGAPVQRMRDRGESLDAAAPARAALYGAARAATLPAAPDASATLADHAAALRLPGVLLARPGWRLRDGWIQPEPAIVVVARPEAVDAVRAALPPALDGTPVDVRPASAAQLLAVYQPASFAMAGATRHEYREPEFPGTVQIAGPPASPAALLAAQRPSKPQIPYARPPGISLDPITAEMELILSASPDAGWSVLRDFLVPRGTLVVGMYDFTAPHIEAALLQGAGTLTLTLDHPPGKSTREQTIDTTGTELHQALGPRLHFAWALERNDSNAAAWIFPNAYHIKVAVRDDDRMWLSSGNWNTTNQPQIDLGDRPGAIATAKVSDRDWHVVARSKELSAVFRAFLQWDNDVAAQHQAGVGAVAAGTGSAIPDSLLLLEAAARAPVTFFPPRTISGRITVRPLLTPQDYQPHVLALIQGATSRFYMQTQYIHPSGRAGDEDHDALIAAVAALIGRGIDVRLITSEFQDAGWVEKLMSAGVSSRVLRIQPKVHNKGIVVDSRVCVVSSQNWSADGTLRNRDAGLVIENEEAARYFEQIFLHDWAHLAAQSLPGVS